MSRYLMVIAFLLAWAVSAQGARTAARILIVPQGAQNAALTPTIVISSPDLKRGSQTAVKEATLLVAGRAADEKGIASVSVNGVAAKLNEKGDFAAEILLKPGRNQVTVLALDTAGNQGFEKFEVSRQSDEVALFADEAGSESGKNYALVIGINHYQKIAQLKTAVHDAQEVARELQEQYDFTPTLLLDEKATRAAILKELNAIKNRMTANDSLIIFYAGHGWMDKVTETSYWMPVDADKDDLSNWLEARTVTDELKRSQAHQALIVADSCYSGTITRAFEPKLEQNGITRESYLRKMMVGPSRVLISSGGDEPVSDSGGAGHSVFTDVFLQALKNPIYQRFTAEELVAWQLKEPVAGRSNQTPEFKVLGKSGHVSGDFVFTKIK